jgi:hypothetical protein
MLANFAAQIRFPFLRKVLFRKTTRDAKRTMFYLVPFRETEEQAKFVSYHFAKQKTCHVFFSILLKNRNSKYEKYDTDGCFAKFRLFHDTENKIAL